MYTCHTHHKPVTGPSGPSWHVCVWLCPLLPFEHLGQSLQRSEVPRAPCVWVPPPSASLTALSWPSPVPSTCIQGTGLSNVGAAPCRLCLAMLLLALPWEARGHR
jgi:hypothetical protein